MSVKAMVFIDGGWLYRSRSALFERLDSPNGFEIDYAKLPRMICETAADYLDEDVSLVRTLYFGTIPSFRSGFNTSKQNAFYDFLERTCGYETHIHEVDVGQSEPRADEIWVKMSLASAMMYYAAQSGAYDMAVLVSDDADYAPVLRGVRRFGKRIQIAGLRAFEETRPVTLFQKSRVRDFPPLYIDDRASDIRLVRERLKRVCKQCGNEEETTWAGPDFFCLDCRGTHRN
jgi:uncharacterized LabA/DUF88 family protein